MCELERDCVILTPHAWVECVEEHPVWRCAKQLSLAMKRWPFLTRTFETGFHPSAVPWDAGPLHCCIQFAPKPRCDAANRRPVADMMGFVLHMLLKTVSSMHELRRGHVRDNLLNKLDDGEFGPFWWMSLDGGKQGLHPKIVDDILKNLDGTSVENAWNRRFVQCVTRYHARIPDIGRVFRHDTRPFDILHACLMQQGYALLPAAERPALVVPTMWKVDGYPCRGQKFALHIKCVQSI